MNRRINNFIEHRINEAKESGTPRSNAALINTFFEALGDAAEKAGMQYSYSTYAIESEKKRSTDPKSDFSKIMSNLNKNGWTESALTNLFDTLGDDIIKIYNNGEGINKLDIQDLTSRYIGLDNKLEYSQGDAGHDIFFYYFVSKDAIILAGYDYEEATVNQNTMEYWIKFRYGYQNTVYGQLVLNQQFGSVDNWYKFGANLVARTLFDEDASDYGFEEIEELLDFVNDDLPEEVDVTVDQLKAAVKKGVTYDDGSKTVSIDLTNTINDLLDGNRTIIEKIVTTLKAVVNEAGSVETEGNIVTVNLNKPSK